MTQKQLIDTVRQHHPNMSEVQIRSCLNSALEEFCRKTRILEFVFQFTTTEDQRYYTIDGSVLEIKSVDYDGKTISRLSGRPEIRDLT